nr:hypothetical protein [Candidatus Njordarchaeum guaymaensis]
MYKVRVHHSMNVKKFPTTWRLTNCLQYGTIGKETKPSARISKQGQK